ncbi:DNA polymerase IV [Martelella mediterranea]|uniref:DNA polymerase IV n=1 Tax=Martelella mediterranea TaxID=293089 RepID=UPI001E298082|nr:DNA polymerase IV [Martelella mediterranea]MCD1632992.1 DNA polymerase IV [Martelella mediterranea]
MVMAETTPTPEALCRDCLKATVGEARRCRHCGSPRLLRHTELHTLSIAHIDCDAFYAAIEKRDNPELADKPLIIGGGKRGVVSTACYIARISGVKSAMPMFKALEACPDAVVIRPNMEKYVAVGRQLRAMMLELTPLVEPLSIDEAFLDLTGTGRLHRASPAVTLARFAKRVEAELGITISIGLSYCKFLAKIASDLNKPRGFSVIGEAEAKSFLADKPVGMIWGVGKAFTETLKRDGITTIGQFQTMEKNELLRRYGVIGPRLYHLARGEDTRSVKPERGTKSISNETTFNTDISDLEELSAILRRLSEKTARRAKAAGFAGHTVVLKLKTADFKIRTRNRHLSAPTQLADRIFSNGLSLLKNETDGTKYRLIGIGISDLCDPATADPPDLVDPGAAKRAAAEGAIDRLRGKYGLAAVETGYTFRPDRGKSGRDE